MRADCPSCEDYLNCAICGAQIEVAPFTDSARLAEVEKERDAMQASYKREVAALQKRCREADEVEKERDQLESAVRVLQGLHDKVEKERDELAGKALRLAEAAARVDTAFRAQRASMARARDLAEHYGGSHSDPTLTATLRSIARLLKGDA